MRRVLDKTIGTMGHIGLWSQSVVRVKVLEGMSWRQSEMLEVEL